MGCAASASAIASRVLSNGQDPQNRSVAKNVVVPLPPPPSQIQHISRSGVSFSNKGDFATDLKSLCSISAKEVQLVQFAEELVTLLKLIPSFILKATKENKDDAIITCIDMCYSYCESILNPILVVTERMLSNKEATTVLTEEGTGWDLLDFVDFLKVLETACTSVYELGVMEIGRSVSLLLEISFLLLKAIESEAKKKSKPTKRFSVPSIDNLLSMVAVFLFKTVTPDTKDAVQHKLDDYQQLRDQVGWSDEHLACCIDAPSKGMLLYLCQASRTGDRTLKVTVRRTLAFDDALAQALASLEVMNALTCALLPGSVIITGNVPSDLNVKTAPYKIFPTFVNMELLAGLSITSSLDLKSSPAAALEAGEGHGPRKEFFLLAGENLAPGSAAAAAAAAVTAVEGKAADDCQAAVRAATWGTGGEASGASSASDCAPDYNLRGSGSGSTQSGAELSDTNPPGNVTVDLKLPRAVAESAVPLDSSSYLINDNNRVRSASPAAAIDIHNYNNSVSSKAFPFSPVSSQGSAVAPRSVSVSFLSQTVKTPGRATSKKFDPVASHRQLFKYNRAGGCFWYNTELKPSRDLENAYHFAGWLMGQCVHNRAPLGINFPPVFFTIALSLFGEPVSVPSRVNSMSFTTQGVGPRVMSSGQLGYSRSLTPGRSRSPRAQMVVQGSNSSFLRVSSASNANAPLLTSSPALTLADLASYDPEAARSLNNLTSLPLADFRQMLDLEGLRITMTPAEYITVAVRRIMVEDVMWQAKAVGTGISRALDRSLAAFWRIDGKCLSEMVLGGSTDHSGDGAAINVRKLFRVALDDELRGPDGRVVIEAFWKVIDGWPRQRQIRFLEFVTGSPRLPLAGSELLKIQSPFVPLGIAEHRRLLGTLPQAHTCDNLLELPNYWTSLLHVEGVRLASQCPQGRSAELKRRCAEILEDRLSLAVNNFEGYNLDERSKGDEDSNSHRSPSPSPMIKLTPEILASLGKTTVTLNGVARDEPRPPQPAPAPALLPLSSFLRFVSP